VLVRLRSGIAPLLALCSLVVACSGSGGDAAPAANAATPNAPGASGAKGPEGAAPGAPGAPRGGPPAIVLAASDVQTVTRGKIEAAVPVTGDLKPIEEVNVRARLEGDLVGVYVREGERVRAGQLLARFEDSEQASNRASAEADRAAAKSDLTTAEWNAEQAESLFKAGAIAEFEVRTARQSVEASRARLAAAEARVRSTSSFERDTRVLAPTSGVIETRLVENGEHVARGASMFTLVRSDVLELAASVPARLATGIRPQQAVRFIAAGRALEGRVARVSPTINPANRSLTVYVQVPNADGTLRGNTLATGRIIGRSIPDALLVPTSALRQAPNGGAPFVYRVAKGVIEHVDIQLGVVDDDAGTAEVLEGLAEGDQIVVGNVGTVGRGMKVQIVTGENQRATR
jgi:membrane fusion protein (multidrug efflux system)